MAGITSDEANGLGTIAQVDGKTYGLPYSINVKSLVWYNPAAFAKAGLTVPTTDAEMTALEKKVRDGLAGDRLARRVRAALRRPRRVQQVDHR